MDLNKIISYVKSDNHVTFGGIEACIFLYFFFSFIGVIATIVTRHYFVCGIVVLLPVIYWCGVIYLKKKCKIITLYTQILIDSFSTLFGCVYFLFFIYVILLSTDRATPMYCAAILAGMLLMGVFCFLCILLMIRRGRFLDGQKSKNGLLLWLPTVSGALGISFARTFLKNISQDAAINIMVWGLFFLSSVFLFATTNFLKCYYIKKYSIIECQQKTYQFVFEKVKKPSKARKFGVICIYIIGIFLLVLIIIGIIVTSS